jgi:hypothetical protein
MLTPPLDVWEWYQHPPEAEAFWLKLHLLKQAEKFFSPVYGAQF